MEKKTIQELITQVEESASSIFSKSDVLEILKSVDTKGINMTELKKELHNSLIDTDFRTYLDENSTSFSITDNVIYLEDFQLITEEVADDIMDGLSYLFVENTEDFDQLSELTDKKGCGADCACKKKKKKSK